MRHFGTRHFAARHFGALSGSRSAVPQEPARDGFAGAALPYSPRRAERDAKRRADEDALMMFLLR